VDKPDREGRADRERDRADKPETALVSPYGDDAPKTNPIIILPVNRHPIFPGFMVS
jgi:hypothetical protein